jgi:hypothetical protein
MPASEAELRPSPWRLFHQIPITKPRTKENANTLRPISAFISLRSAYAGTVLTVLGVALKLKFCIELTTLTPADGSVGWNPRSIWIHWGPLPQGLILTGLLMVFCGMIVWAFRAALPQVMIYGLAFLIVASLTLTGSELLRCAAFGPMLTAILMGLVLLVIALCRFVWVGWSCRAR